ncbi:exopolyphosphatase [Thiomicrospira sp. WB1]|uniref:exopolyphosphatase n=1 Tax=Thiomicrospira sp. WB1 TaxID=1685380 RepID=UPI0007481E22|nr:exopolyphosphatase [Thiomicrospira sp. WB1]KUJ71442.1 exopolyphosphatase [Thiomicrospira sp. WB1]
MSFLNHLLPFSQDEEGAQGMYAAIDLGSNSFHLVIARELHGQVQIVDKHKEMIRLRSGLDKKGYLTETAFENGIACLERFGQLIKNLPANHIRAVGTNTLRNARNSQAFLTRAKQALGHDIQIIGGQEEARLIYLGVAHGLPQTDEQRLVMDIGGGSTEYIIGKAFEHKHLTSTEMGCVSITQRFFHKPEISEKRMNKAISRCRQILRPHYRKLTQMGWDNAYGASGTIKALGGILVENGWDGAEQGSQPGSITLKGLYQIRDSILKAGSVAKAELKGLKEERIPVLAGGLAILIATFEEVGIQQMQVSSNALREGLIYDTLGRLYDADVRETSVTAAQAWLKVDRQQAQAVAHTSLELYEQVEQAWALHDSEYEYDKLLKWAAQLHEAGIALSYKRYRYHSAYLIENFDMAGFTQQEKQMLGALLLNHRGKFLIEPYARLDAPHDTKLQRLTVLLRLAVRLHRGRETDRPNMQVSVYNETGLAIHFEADWLAQHPLTRLDLEIEAQRLQGAGFDLTFE